MVRGMIMNLIVSVDAEGANARSYDNSSASVGDHAGLGAPLLVGGRRADTADLGFATAHGYVDRQLARAGRLAQRPAVPRGVVCRLAAGRRLCELRVGVSVLSLA